MLFSVLPLFGADLNDYTGDYVSKNNGIITISKFDLGDGKDRLLFLNFSTGRTCVLSTTFTCGPGLLVDEPVEIKLLFASDEQNRITSLSIQDEIFRKSPGFAQEEVTFKNGDVTLSGTLTLPPGKGPYPSIVILHGSDAARRETFGPLPNFFARQGFAVLVYDKRGDGMSTGDWRKSAFSALSADAIAAVEFLKSRDDVDPKRIGLMGNSEGGWVALQAASSIPDLGYLILRVTPAITPALQDLHRVEPILKAEGATKAEIAEAIELAKLKQEFARTGKGWDKYLPAAQKLQDKPWYTFAGGSTQEDNWWWSWYRTKMDYDPVPDLKKVKCPVLLLYGERDSFVLPEENKMKMQDSLRANKNATIVVLPKANHAFLEAKTGSPFEIPSLKNFVPDYFTILIQWLNKISAPG